VKKIILIVPILIPVAYATTLHVPTEYATISAGIAASQNGDTVLVASGTYTGDGNRDLDFEGKQIIVKSESGPNITIIDCGGTIEFPHRGFNFCSSETANSMVDGFTIQGGCSNGDGGAIYCTQASPIIQNCVITGNTAHSGNGGGIACTSSGRPLIRNCEISYNHATTSEYMWVCGGGVYVTGQVNASFEDCQITGNYIDAPMGPTNGGGAFCGNHASVMFNNCSIRVNNSFNDGGAICCQDTAVVTVLNCILEDNFAIADGGAISVSMLGKVIVSNSDLRRNHTGGGWGGGINVNHAIGLIDNSIFEGNYTHIYGGGIMAAGSRLAVSGCTFTADTALIGGGIHLRDTCSAEINLCSFINDFGMDQGGGLYCEMTNAAIDSCLFNDNEVVGLGPAINLTFSSPTLSYCTFTNNYSSFSGGMVLVSASPLIINCTFLHNDSYDPSMGSALSIYDLSEPIVSNSIIAYNTGRAVVCFGDRYPRFSCSNIYGNEYGDWIECIADQGGVRGNLSDNPLFCDTTRSNYHLDGLSPCAPMNNSCGMLI
jgi:parallel beta-helix repeat protein/predicted outer membrane repeat protein